MVRQMVVLLMVGGGFSFGGSVQAAVMITQGSAPSYATSLNFDEPDGPTGNGIPSNAWAAAPYFIDILGFDFGPNAVGDNSTLTGADTNSFFGSFGVRMLFANDLTELSLQAWNDSGPPDPIFGGGMVIVVFNDGGDPLALDVVTPAFGGAGEPKINFTTTDSTVFDEVILQGFGFTPDVYIDNLSWNAVPEPSFAVWLGMLGLAALRIRGSRSAANAVELRANGGRATRRLRVETLEDRRLLSFSPAVNYAVGGSYSPAIATADFNNDGNLDLAATFGYSVAKVSLRLGNGAGGFGAAQELTVGGYYPSSIAVADFNGDNKLDIVVAKVGDFSILMGQGDGTFQSAITTPTGDFPALAVGHFNNDSHIDLVEAWHSWDMGRFYRVHLGNGQGGFASSFGYDPLLGDGGLATVDLNNDGKLDVVNADGFVLLGTGNGTFLSDYMQQIPLSGGAAVATGNFTGDGNADLVAVGNNVLAVLRGRGDGGFLAPIHHNSANGSVHGAIATADFDADGELDAVVTDNDRETLSVMLGHGDGTLHYAGAFATGTSPSAMTVGDFNRDGRPDVAAANAGSNNLSVLLNDGNWTTTPAVDGDFNHDGRWDCADINMLSTAITTHSTDLAFDMNQDGTITLADITDNGVGWLAIGGANNPAQTGGHPFIRGDATLDGVVDGSDFNQWNAHKFSVDSQWCNGDFNASGAVDGSDFGIWNSHKFTSSILIVAPVRIPAPSRFEADRSITEDHPNLIWLSGDPALVPHRPEQLAQQAETGLPGIPRRLADPPARRAFVAPIVPVDVAFASWDRVYGE